MANVTTSLVVQFGSDTDAASYTLTAELDSRPDGLNGGNTSFVGGDSPFFLVYKSDDLALSFITTQGGIRSSGTVTTEVTQWVTFTNSKSVRLSKPPLGSVSLEHFGGDTGANVVGEDVVLSEPGVAVYKATYDSKAYAYQMTNIPTTINGETSFQVVVVITGTAV